MLQSPKSWSETGVHQFKVGCHRARRLLLWSVQAQRYPVPALAHGTAHPFIVYDRTIPIRRADQDADPLLEEGKVQNLRLAAPHFDGIALGPERPLSFWRTLGQLTHSRGFRYGMELRAGCLVPSLGGGICLLSNALFEMSVRLGWRILERHGHTIEAVPSRTLPWGLDATVFWPYVDLRVQPRSASVLRVRVQHDALHLQVACTMPMLERVEVSSRMNTLEGNLRSNEVWRRRLSPDGVLLEEIRVAQNRKRLLHTSGERRRTCLTCDEVGCRARVTV